MSDTRSWFSDPTDSEDTEADPVPQGTAEWPVIHIVDPDNPFKFLSLPRELRNEVYGYLFLRDRPVFTSRIWFTTREQHVGLLTRENLPDCCGKNWGCSHYDARLRPFTGILRTCRQVSEEALDLLYTRNTFHVELENMSRYLNFFKIGERNLRRVRKLQLSAYTYHYAYRIAGPGEVQWPFFRPAANEVPQWSALLDGLNTLQFVIKVPIWGHHSGWPVWVAQLETVMGFIGEHVGEETDVAIDDNYSLYLCEAVDRCFGKPFRRPQTSSKNVPALMACLLVVVLLATLASTTNLKANEFKPADCSGKKNFSHASPDLVFMTMKDLYCMYLEQSDWLARTWQAYLETTANGGICYGDVLGNFER
ncbi:hypothetical protein F5Y05DRAFT_413803 [Hypoxylon sp. FL0543]|nr:hypothetical protein F5Y05DRAFT_413803 [Hypoxylon sp. FL0543]